MVYQTQTSSQNPEDGPRGSQDIVICSSYQYGYTEIFLLYFSLLLVFLMGLWKNDDQGPGSDLHNSSNRITWHLACNRQLTDVYLVNGWPFLSEKWMSLLGAVQIVCSQHGSLLPRSLPLGGCKQYLLSQLQTKVQLHQSPPSTGE